MPNHISNVLTAPKHVIDFLKNEKGEIDFNKVIPMPETLQSMECSGDIETIVNIIFGIPLNDNSLIKGLEMNNRTTRVIECKPLINDITEERIYQLTTALKNKLKYGHFSWYGWSCEYWGTKWNAYDQGRETETQVYFKTAWNPPFKVIEALSKRFPYEDILLETADEDAGSQCYTVIFNNGNEKSRIEYDGIDAMKHYFRISYNNPSPDKNYLFEHGYNENFEYIEEEDE